MVQLKSEFFERRFQISYFPAGSDGKENREHGNPSAGKPSLPTVSVLRTVQAASQGERDRSESPDSLDEAAAGCGMMEAISAKEERLEYQSQLSQLRAQHESELRARDFQIASLKARVERSSAEIEEWKRVASEGEQFKIRVHQLVEQNNELISRLDDRDEKMASLEREGKHLERLRQEIYSAVPDLNGIVEMVTSREREEREERDRKVLRILKSKDQKVAELQGENSGLSRVVTQLRNQLQQLEATNSDLSRELEGTVHSREERIRSLQAELNKERGRAAALQRSLEDMRHDEGEWAALKRQVSELLRQGDESEKVRARLESDVEDLLRERTEREGQVAACEEKNREWKAQERKMAAMHRQMQEQADQLDCLVSELASRNGGELPIAFASLSGARDKDRTGEIETTADLKDQVCDSDISLLQCRAQQDDLWS